MTSKEAANLFGVHTNTIYNMVHEGRLVGTAQGGVTEESVDAISSIHCMACGEATTAIEAFDRKVRKGKCGDCGGHLHGEDTTPA